MSVELPPTIDPQAAARWAAQPHAESPWLHEEVGRRMAERLQWIKLPPKSWLDWEPTRGGVAAHAAVARQYPGAGQYVFEPTAKRADAAMAALRARWWKAPGWLGPRQSFELPANGAVDMVWANMALHMAADPQALLAQWHAALAHDGFLMFSSLGPDSLGELRRLYRAQGWPPPSHEFTDMHDWGDMLVNAGFAEPVMDMERITLSFATPSRLLAELRPLGRNLHSRRFTGLRGKGWHARLLDALASAATDVTSATPISATFEIIYGHAFKPGPRMPVQAQTVLSLDDMRRVLHQGGGAPRRRR